MKRIEEQTNKFNTIKSKLENLQLTKLTDSVDKSILDIINFPKTKNNVILNSIKNFLKNDELIKNMSLNNKETKIKERNKFYTQKYPEENEFKDIKPKEVLKNERNEKNEKFPQNKNYLNQNFVKNNFSGNNIRETREIVSDSYGASINLLNMANGEIKPQEVNKKFKEERIEEEKKSLKQINEEKEEKEEAQEKNNTTQKKYISDEDDEEIEIDKNKSSFKNNNEILKNILAISKKESGINFNQNFDIFDESKMMKVHENSFGDIEDFDNNYPSKNINNTVENENNINIIQLKEKENKNQENDFANNSLGSFKICIPLDEYKFDLKIPLDNNNEKKYLGKKTKLKENPIRKKSIASKSDNSANMEYKNNIPKNNKKVILDEEDDEGEYINKKEKGKNNISSALFKSPKSKKEQKNNNGGALIKKEGTKFTFVFESEKKDDNNKLGNENKKAIKNNSSNSTPKKKFNSPHKNIDINDSNKIKNNINKNKINLINKNKNGSQNISNKDIINNNKYESQCLNNINKILIEIEDKLFKEKIEKNFMKKCFEICGIIKNMINNPSKKKTIYLGFLSILKNLFFNLSENKVCKNYLNEINHIFQYIQKYFKDIKKCDENSNNNSLFSKRKIAFKYAFSKLELKNMDENSVKKLLPEKNNENINNENYINGLIKFAKISKRYLKTSKFLLKELKEFREKIKNSQTKSNFKKYESCPADIQMSPHFMSYNRLFYHCYIILSFYNDYKILNNELNEKNGISNSKDKINIEKNKSRSNQIKPNLNGYGHHGKNKEKERDKSVDKIRERDKSKEKNHK